MPLLKKKPRDKKAEAAQTPAWHPNFRNFERLPDTKTVRTSFFINIGAVTAALVLLLFTGMREVSLRSLVADTDLQQEHIERDKSASVAGMAQFQKFQAEEKKLRELEEFVGPGTFVLSDFLLHLGEQLPRKVALTYVEYRSGAVILRGNVRGTPDEAAGDADTYFRQLRDDLKYGPLFEDVSATAQDINQGTGMFTFELTLKFKDTAPKPPPAKEKEAEKAP